MKVIFDATFGEVWVDGLTAFFRSHKDPRTAGPSQRLRHLKKGKNGERMSLLGKSLTLITLIILLYFITIELPLCR